jgi:hypothetical protein
MAPKRKPIEEVKSKTIVVRITDNESKAIETYIKETRRAKGSDLSKDQSNVSEIVRKSLMTLITHPKKELSELCERPKKEKTV